MKNKTIMTLGLALTCTAIANAQVDYNFNSDAQGFQNFGWSASGPAGWSGGASIQAQPAVGGWTLGGTFNFMNEFSGANQLTMQSLSSSGNGQLSFDVLLDGTSFTPGVANWYSINIAGNSAGANGWTQVEKVSGDAWHNADDNNLVSTHVVLSFAQLGWNDPDDATGWFQIFFGANSADDFPIKFYIDNVTATAVPEPSTIALAGLGLAGLLAVRRRKS
jgi:PEP-CTERM motif